ncbi:MAG: F0F1 ATP synthase subunit A [Clostridia bacterium]|nr:F0F1 ATP synthase subunit A [Clostridia bacterium]
MILPILTAIVITVLFSPPTDGVEITGALIFFTIPMPIQDFPITEAQINSALVMISIFCLCLYMTHGLKENPELKRQHIAEMIVEKAEALVKDNMGEHFPGFAPFIASILALSAFSSLLSLFGLFPPTSDLNIVAGWAILVFALITYYKFKCGPLNYAKSFAEPPALAPLNVISEVATPISMALRHYGNVLSGTVIGVLIATALQGLSHLALGWAPGFLADIPLFQVGLPAVLSIYFDVFSGILQAYIFAMLTMLYVSGAFNVDLYLKLRAEKKMKKENKLKKQNNESKILEEK